MDAGTPCRPRPGTPASEPVPQPASGEASAPEPTPPQHREPRVKLDDDDVRAIRADYAEGKWRQGDLAYICGVTQSTISAVVSGDTWAHVTDQPIEQE